MCRTCTPSPPSLCEASRPVPSPCGPHGVLDEHRRICRHSLRRRHEHRWTTRHRHRCSSCSRSHVHLSAPHHAPIGTSPQGQPGGDAATAVRAQALRLKPRPRARGPRPQCACGLLYSYGPARARPVRGEAPSAWGAIASGSGVARTLGSSGGSSKIKVSGHGHGLNVLII